MAEYSAFIEWERRDAAFTDNRYSRAHAWRFDGGSEVPASSSPQAVPVPLSDPAAVDPEEAFVASLASCHMLWFLAIAAKRSFVIDSYRDEACGTLGRDADGRMAMTVVMLRPAVVFSGPKIPQWAAIVEMHHEAHEQCYIANSVRTEVRCEPAEALIPLRSN